MNNSKLVDSLTPEDADLSPVWEFAIDQEQQGDDTKVRPVLEIPVGDLANRLVLTRVRLSNGSVLPALLGNLDLSDAERTSHVRTVSLFHEGRWLFLARYHDLDYAENGPSALASSLKLGDDEVFPITYDITSCCIGNPDVVVGQFEQKPRTKLTRAEIISMAVRRHQG